MDDVSRSLVTSTRTMLTRKKKLSTMEITTGPWSIHVYLLSSIQQLKRKREKCSVSLCNLPNGIWHLALLLDTSVNHQALSDSKIGKVQFDKNENATKFRLKPKGKGSQVRSMQDHT